MQTTTPMQRTLAAHKKNGRSVTPAEPKAEAIAAVVGAEEELMELRGKLDAINKAQAVIEFNLDGTG